jgi:hypothetical protein
MVEKRWTGSKSLFRENGLAGENDRAYRRPGAVKEKRKL